MRSGFCVGDADVGDEKEHMAAFLGLGECGPVLTDVFGAVPVALGDSSAPAPSIRAVAPNSALFARGVCVCGIG